MQVFEELITLSSGDKITVYCKGIEEFKSLLQAIIDENNNRMNKGWINFHEMKDRRIMKRFGRGGISYEEFRAAYF